MPEPPESLRLSPADLRDRHAKPSGHVRVRAKGVRRLTQTEAKSHDLGQPDRQASDERVEVATGSRRPRFDHSRPGWDGHR